jgi:hypothetical protein
MTKKKIYPLLVFISIAVAVIVFEACLASGMPWGEYAFGGKFPGKLPSHMRGASVIQAFIWCLWILIALARSGIILPGLFSLSKKLMWLVVTLNCVAVILNVITPSAAERMIWAPVAIIGLVSSFLIATQNSASPT